MLDIPYQIQVSIYLVTNTDMKWDVIILQVPVFTLTRNEKINISLTSDSETPFKGFVLKAVDVPGSKIVGSFSILETGDTTTAKYLPCTHPQSSISHADNDLK